ncbi:hypothetical protein ACE6H2_000840 [Prunus campanulata]
MFWGTEMAAIREGFCLWHGGKGCSISYLLLALKRPCYYYGAAAHFGVNIDNLVEDVWLGVLDVIFQPRQGNRAAHSLAQYGLCEHPQANPFPSHTTITPPPTNPLKLLNLHKRPNPATIVASSISSSSSSTLSSAIGHLLGPQEWALDSWKSNQAHQLPVYSNSDELRTILTTLETFPPIVFAGEAWRLETWLGKAAMGEAFFLQGGDCAESFKEFNANNIKDTFRVFLQMAITLI